MPSAHPNLRAVRSISPVAIGTTGTGKAGKIVDRAGFEAVEFVFSYGAITATNAVFTPVVMEGDVTGTMTSIADADLLGTELLAGIAATTPRTSGVSMNITKRLGYIGAKRYVQVGKLSSTITAGTPVGADVLLMSPRVRPTAA